MFYSCSEAKSVSDAEPRRLADCSEARDILLQVFAKDGFCIAVLKFGAVALPEDLEPKLREMIGHEIACLRLAGKYYCRDLEAEGRDHA